MGSAAISWVKGCTRPGAIGSISDGSWATASTKDCTASVTGVAVGSNVADEFWVVTAVVVAVVVDGLAAGSLAAANVDPVVGSEAPDVGADPSTGLVCIADVDDEP